MNETDGQYENLNMANPQKYFVFILVLFLSFLAAELGNVLVFLKICKTKIINTTADLLKALTISNGLLCVFSVLPPCLTLVHSNWVQNKAMCTLQGFLENVFITTTSFFLVCLSTERFSRSASKDVAVRKETLRTFITAVFICGGVIVSFSFIGEEPFAYVPTQLSCDFRTVKMSPFYYLITTFIPCCVTLVLSAMTLVSAKQKNRRIFGGQNESCAYGNAISMSNNQIPTAIAKEKRTTLVLACIQIVHALSLSSLVLVKFLSEAFLSDQEIFLKTSLFLVGFSCMVFPGIFLLMTVRKNITFVNRTTIDSSEPPIFVITNGSPKARHDLRDGNEIPNFLRRTSVHLQVSSSNNLHDDGTQEPSKKHSTASALSCEIQFGHVLKNFDCREERMSLHSVAADSMDSVFVRVNSSVENGSLSVSSYNDCFSDNSPSRNPFLAADTSSEKSRHPSNESVDISFCRRHTLPPLKYNLSKPKQAWCTEPTKREEVYKKHSFNHKFSRHREISVSLLTPVEDAGSLECSPKVSIDSKTTRHPHNIRISRLNSCLEKLEEA